MIQRDNVTIGHCAKEHAYLPHHSAATLPLFELPPPATESKAHCFALNQLGKVDVLLQVEGKTYLLAHAGEQTFLERVCFAVKFKRFALRMVIVAFAEEIVQDGLIMRARQHAKFRDESSCQVWITLIWHEHTARNIPDVDIAFGAITASIDAAERRAWPVVDSRCMFLHHVWKQSFVDVTGRKV